MEEWKIETKGGFTDLSSFQGGSASGVTIHGGFTREKELKLDGDTFDIAWDPWSENNDPDSKLKSSKKYDTPTTTLKSFKSPTGNAKEDESRDKTFKDALKVLENSVGTDDKGNTLKSARGYAEEWGLNNAPNLLSLFNVGRDTLSVMDSTTDAFYELADVLNAKKDPNKKWWEQQFIGEWSPEIELKEYYNGTFTTHNRFGELPAGVAFDVNEIPVTEEAIDSSSDKIKYELIVGPTYKLKDHSKYEVVPLNETSSMVVSEVTDLPVTEEENLLVEPGWKFGEHSWAKAIYVGEKKEVSAGDAGRLPEGDKYHVQEKNLVGIERKDNKPFFSYSVPTEDVYIGHYISKVYSDVKKFQNIFAKIYSVKPANTTAFEAQFKFAGEDTWTDLDFRYEGIEIPEQKKETFNINYGPTGFDAVKTPLGIQDNEFTIKVLLSKDLREFFHFAKKVGFGYIDEKKGLNLNYITSHEVRGKDCTLYLKMRSNAWQSQIGTGGYNVNQLTKRFEGDTAKGLIDVDKKMPQWVFEKFKVRTIKFPLNFDFTAKRPAELTLVCSALYVYPTF